MTELVTLASLAAVIGVASLLQQATGFGFALAATPLLALAVDAHSAIVLALLIGFLGISWQAVEERKACDVPVAGRMLIGAVVGLVAGLFLFQALDARALQALIGLVVLAAVVALARGIDLQHAGHRLDYGAGLLSGALTTAVGTNGPPVVFALAARGFSPEAFRATLTAVFVLLDAVAIGISVAVGAVTTQLLMAVAVTLPALVAGGAAGRRLRRLLPPDRFRRLTLFVLAGVGLTALLTAVLGTS